MNCFVFSRYAKIAYQLALLCRTNHFDYIHFSFWIVYQCGAICLNILEGEWSPDYEAKEILLAVQVGETSIWFSFVSKLIVFFLFWEKVVCYRFMDLGDELGYKVRQRGTSKKKKSTHVLIHSITMAEAKP